MTRGQSDTAEASSTADWPTFGLTYTYNPTTELAVDLDLHPDELVVFDGDITDGIEDAWLTAERGSYVDIETVR